MNYESQIDRVVDVSKKYLKSEPKVIVEVGAKDCKESVAFSTLFPRSMIHVFECNPVTLPICRERVAGIKNITLHETALSDVKGKISFGIMAVDPGSSSIFTEIEHEDQYGQTHVEVPSSTLDHEFKGVGSQPDILWMDAQGAELKILMGAKETLPRISFIHSEIYFKKVYEGQPLYWDIKRYLNENGFDLLLFSSLGRNFADAVFINRNIYKRKTPQWFTEAWFFFRERLFGHTRGLLIRLGLRK